MILQKNLVMKKGFDIMMSLNNTTNTYRKYIPQMCNVFFCNYIGIKLLSLKRS